MHLVAVSQLQSDSTPTDLAHRIVVAHAHYCRLYCEPAPDDITADAALYDYCGLLADLATLEAAGPDDVWAQAAALETCIVHHLGQPSIIEGDFGLAVSLLRDLRRPAVLSRDAGRVKTSVRLVEEPICRTLAQPSQEPCAAARV